MLVAVKSRSFAGVSPDQVVDALASHFVQSGLLDANGLERARRTAAESGQRMDTVLTQLGLVSERALAEATASLLSLKLVAPGDYPEAAILPERFRLKFLRKARAIPIALSERSITVAMADPMDDFAASSIAVAAGLCRRSHRYRGRVRAALQTRRDPLRRGHRGYRLRRHGGGRCRTSARPCQ
jgi:hypothetical protein